MHIFKHKFPEDSTFMMVKKPDGFIELTVSTPRPSPEWLKTVENKRKRLVGLKGQLSLRLNDDELRDQLTVLIARSPGRARSYYTQLSGKQGGVVGLQARKEKALQELILSGKVFVHPLDHPIGRKTFGLWLPK